MENLPDTTSSTLVHLKLWTGPVLTAHYHDILKRVSVSVFDGTETVYWSVSALDAIYARANTAAALERLGYTNEANVIRIHARANTGQTPVKVYG